MLKYLKIAAHILLMKTIELLEELRKRPLFTVNDIARLLRKNEAYVKVAAYRLKKRGLIRSVERGKYTVHDDPVLFASYIATPSYISFWTALRMHNMTEQMPSDVMIAVRKSKNEIAFSGRRITFTKTGHFWGYSKMRYMGFDIFVAEKEKAIIDCLLAKNTPFDEAAKAILDGEYDAEKLIGYARKTGNSSLAKRIGYLLEKCRADASGLLDLADSNYVPLDWSAGTKGYRDARWKILVNKRLDDL